MAVYILRADVVEQVRFTASQVWKTYIENTPRTLKRALGYLIKKYVQMIVRDQPLNEIAQQSIRNFSSKYGETFFALIVEKEREPHSGDQQRRVHSARSVPDARHLLQLPEAGVHRQVPGALLPAC